MSNTLSAWVTRFWAASWPRDCFVCDENAGAEAVCAHCTPLLPWLDARASCPCCALPSPQGLLCGRCLKRTPHFEASQALFAYATPMREMVLALKHGTGFAQLDWLAHRLAERCSAFAAPDLIIPMPLHASRLAERGFNQAAELARALRRHLPSPTKLALDLVVRDTDTPRLEGLRQKERLRAVRGAFRCRQPVTGLHVLVIDDVMTSGATLNELARTLKMSGAARVSNLVLARTLYQPKK
nr:ComF family protein [Uliginosibacterium gangwonense]